MPQVAIVMPKMSMTMTEGELLTWHVKVGDEIKLGDVVCEVATDKIDMEVEATAAGKVIALHGNPGDVLDVGAALLTVESESDDLLAGIFDAPAAPVVESSAPAPAPTTAPVVQAVPPAAETVSVLNEKPLATPKARATAADMNLDIRIVQGTGIDGVIKTEDVLNAQSAPSTERTLAARAKTRLAIARAIEASRNIPAFSMTFEIPAGAAGGTGADRTAFVVNAWARTLRAFPELHADWNGGSPATFAEVRVAISVMAAHGVVTPVVTVPVAPAANFGNELAEIIRQAAQNHVAVEHLQSSSTGLVEIQDASVIAASGILIRPQSLAAAVSAARADGKLTLVLTADHRLADPADLLLVARRFAAELR